MNIQESVNRGYNLLVTSIIGLTGVSFLPETFIEKDVPDKLDDLALFILAVVAVWWYNKSRNRFARSAVPVVFAVLALAIKVVGIIIEHDDAEALGDDIGGLILLLSTLCLVVFQYKKSAKLIAPSA